ncbi:MAG TPA: methylenetetrahydrofolate reductase [Steroidobacteraceae bacterium]|nr:methylenetetrahydrofolate reductase [Steroidobacteraceae bacterium]
MSVASLAREASIEMSCLDSSDFQVGRESLWPGQKVYVSHLPRQTWAQTHKTCTEVAAAGFSPVPHLPVRLLRSEQQLDEVLCACRDAGARELLLIAGDYAAPQGPYYQVREILLSGRLQKYGFTSVSLAGHPEGHPVVPADEIRQAQLEKSRSGIAAGMQVTLVTQFFFEATPFVHWARDLRLAGVEARLVAGLPGPAGISRLLRLARHCGVGPSIRALSSQPRSMLNLLSERSPDTLLHDLAAERQRKPDLFDGIHLYSFGGFLRTAAWLRQQALL